MPQPTMTIDELIQFMRTKVSLAQIRAQLEFYSLNDPERLGHIIYFYKSAAKRKP